MGNIVLEVNDLDFSKSLTKKEKEEIITSITNKNGGRNVMRFLVDQYYQSQKFRITAENQVRSVIQGYDMNSGETHPLFIQRTLKNARVQEELNKKYLHIATDQVTICKWMRSIKGIGPVIAASLYAAFDITKVQYATEFLSYAGLNDNNNKWLGKAGAKKLMSSALSYRKGIYDSIEDAIICLLKNTNINKSITDICKELKKIINKGLSVNDFLSTMCGVDVLSTLELYGANPAYLQEFVLYKNNTKRADNILYAYVANVTGRKITLVEKGANVNWSKKKNHPEEVSVDDLESYLAKPPYNTQLKTCCYNIAACFVRNKNRGSLYGEIYDKRLAEETVSNDSLKYKDQAYQLLKEKKYDDNKTRSCLEQGKLSSGHIDMRARRYAVKLFISHVFEAMYFLEYRKEPPQHYILAIGGHHDYIPPEVDYHLF